MLPENACFTLTGVSLLACLPCNHRLVGPQPKLKCSLTLPSSEYEAAMFLTESWQSLQIDVSAHLTGVVEAGEDGDREGHCYNNSSAPR